MENRRYRRWFLAWRTGDTEDGFWHGEQEIQKMVFWHGEQEIQKMVFSMENRRSRRKTGVATSAPAEGGPKLSCISCSTCLKNNLVNPVNPV